MSISGFLLFPSKDGKDVAYEGKNGWKGVYTPSASASIVFVARMIKVLFVICTSTWRVNNYVSRQGEGINRRNESSIIGNNKILHCTLQQLLRTFELIILCCLETCFNWKPTFLSCVKPNLTNKVFSLHNCWIFSFFQDYGNVKKKRKLAAILGTNSCKTQLLLELLGIIKHKFPKRLKERLLRNYPRSSAGQSPAFWVHWPS